MAPDIELRLDRAQQILIPFDLEVRVQPALKQHPGTAEIDCFLNLFEDRLLRKYVTLFVAQRTVESPRSGKLRTKNSLVDIAVNNVGNHAIRMEPPPYRVGFHSDSDQVVGLEHIDGFRARNHANPL